MRIQYDVHNLPIFIVNKAIDELNNIISKRNNFNCYEVTDTIKYIFKLMEMAKLVCESELNNKYIEMICKYFGVNTSEENNYKCMCDLLKYMEDKIKLHNFHEMLLD